MLRITEALVIVIVYLLLAPFARGQTLNGKLLRLNPTALPTMCAIGDLRVDSGDSYKLKICNALDTWTEISPTGAIINPMTTAGDLIYGGASGTPTRLAASTGLLHAGTTPSWSLLVNADVSGSAAIDYSKLNLTGAILNADLAGSIADTKLDTISTALKVSNSATTAASANTASAIVARDVSGNFSAGTITATFTGNVTGNLTGNVTGNVSGTSGSTTGNAATATALAADPADCAANTKATGINAAGTLTCSSVANADLAGSIAAVKLIGSDIATVGTITSGTWSADTIAINKGGTGQTTANAALNALLPTQSSNGTKFLQTDGSNTSWAVSAGDASNVMTDPGFELGGSWAASGGTLSAATSGSNYMGTGFGVQSGTWDSSSAAQTLTSGAFTVSNGLAGTNGLFRCKVMTPSGTATHTMGLWDGSTLTDTITIPSSTIAQYVEIAKPFGAASSTIAIRFTSVNANEPLISIDDCYIGRNFNLSDVTPITEWTSFTPTGSWSANTTYTGRWRRIGDSLEVQTNIALAGAPTSANLTINLPSGYTIDTAKLANGTGTLFSLGSATIITGGSSVGYFGGLFYNSTTSLLVKSTRNTADFATVTQAVPGTFASGDGLNISYRVPIATWTAQSAVRADNADYDWTSYTPTYTGFGTVASSTMYHRRIGDTLYLRGRFTTGTPTGVEARMSLPTGLTASSTVTALEIAGSGAKDSGVGTTYFAFIPLRETSVSYITFGTQTSTVVGLGKGLGNAISGAGQIISVEASVPIQGWTGNQRASLLVGSVTSNTTGLERVERARVGGAASATTTCTSNPCTIHRQSGSWITGVARGGTGDYTATIAAGIFSGIPSCTINAVGTGYVSPQSIPASATSVSIYSGINSTAQDVYFDIVCMGPR